MAEGISKRNNVTVFGKGSRAFVFAHGFGCDQHMWRYLTPAFEDDYRIILFDYVGAGKSDISAYDSERYSTLEGYAQDVLEVLRELDLKDVIFAGHSVSSIIGALAWLEEPERFSHLIMVAPSPCYLNQLPDYVGGFERADIDGLLDLMDKNFLGWAGFLAPMVMQNSDKPELTGELEESFCSTDPVAAGEFAKATFLSDYRHVLPEVSVPSLILQCSDDVIAPVGVGDYMHERLPCSELRRMKATGHCPHVSHPDETINLIRDYLSSAVHE
ncbi:MAG: alpha/beta hydrolase [Verrucomicrobiales bacterium]|nr:alpha/beta hydrolase [Verrucomicrobiales bacterium]